MNTRSIITILWWLSIYLALILAGAISAATVIQRASEPGFLVTGLAFNIFLVFICAVTNFIDSRRARR